MIEVSIFKEEKYPLNSKKIESTVRNTLSKNGVSENAFVEVAIVGEKKMDELNEKYYKDKVYMHPIFTFPATLESKFSFPPDGKKHLGQIVISYKMAMETANEKKISIDDVIESLVEHGCLHLIGKHHK